MNKPHKNLSWIFPPSAHEFRNEIDSWKEQAQAQAETFKEMQEQLACALKMQEQLESALKTSQEETKAGNASIQSQILYLQKTLQQLQEEYISFTEKLDSIIGGISGLYQKEVPLNVEFERAYYKNFPVCSSQDSPEFKKDFLSLVHRLDEDSVETVVLALQRIKLIQNSADPFMDLYSAKEKDMMRQLAEHFYSNIFQLSNEQYFYRDYYLPINHFESCVFVDKCGLPYLEHPERLSEYDIIDAGAFIGDSALILSPLTNHKVYAFEPVPANYAHMLQTIEMNGLTSVEPFQCALGAQKGKVTISVNDSSSTQFENSAFSYEDVVEVDVTTIDDFVHDHNLQVGLIKADIEGAEKFMLQGAVETLKMQRPALLISIYHNSDDFFTIKPWLESLNLGYKFKIRHSIGGTVMTETILIAEV